VLPGIGKMMGYAYTLHDSTFEKNWEIVEENLRDEEVLRC
jgi:hypothetical protein